MQYCADDEADRFEHEIRLLLNRPGNEASTGCLLAVGLRLIEAALPLVDPDGELNIRMDLAVKILSAELPPAAVRHNPFGEPGPYRTDH